MRFILEPSFIHKIFETLKRYARLLEKKGKKKRQENIYYMSSDVGFYCEIYSLSYLF